MKPILFNTKMVRSIIAGTKTETRRLMKPQPPSDAKFEMSKCGVRCYAFDTSIERPGPNDRRVYMSPYRPGDILYVRETWRVQSAHRFDADVRINFLAGGPMTTIQFPGCCDQYHPRTEYDEFIAKWTKRDGWKPSIHMPKEAARIFLKVEEVVAQQLNDVTLGEIIREGVDVTPPPICRKEFTEEEIKKLSLMTEEKREKYFQNLATATYIGWADYADNVFKAWRELWNSTVDPKDLPLYGFEANPWIWGYKFKLISKTEAIVSEL